MRPLRFSLLDASLRLCFVPLCVFRLKMFCASSLLLPFHCLRSPRLRFRPFRFDRPVSSLRLSVRPPRLSSCSALRFVCCFVFLGVVLRPFVCVRRCFVPFVRLCLRASFRFVFVSSPRSAFRFVFCRCATRFASPFRFVVVVPSFVPPFPFFVTCSSSSLRLRVVCVRVIRLRPLRVSVAASSDLRLLRFCVAYLCLCGRRFVFVYLIPSPSFVPSCFLFPRCALRPSFCFPSSPFRPFASSCLCMLRLRFRLRWCLLLRIRLRPFRLRLRFP